MTREPRSALELPDALVPSTGWPWTSRRKRAITDGPKITVVTPSLNQGQYLEQAIRSVLLQGYGSLEYIVVDGGSNDHSASILERYRPWLSEIIVEKDHGPADALRKGFDRASGEILAWLNADDYLLPGCLHTASSELKRNEEAGATYGHRLIVDQSGRAIDFSLAPRVLRGYRWRMGSWLHQETTFFRRSAYEQAGPPTSLAFDYELFVRMHAMRVRFHAIDRFLGAYRRHSDAISSHSKDRLREDVLQHRKQHLEGSWIEHKVNNQIHRTAPALNASRKFRKWFWKKSGRIGFDLEGSVRPKDTYLPEW